jgi:hypothetical protein
MVLTDMQRHTVAVEVSNKMAADMVDATDPKKYRGYNPVSFRRTASAGIYAHILDTPKFAWWKEIYKDREEAYKALGFDPVTGEDDMDKRLKQIKKEYKALALPGGLSRHTVDNLKWLISTVGKLIKLDLRRVKQLSFGLDKRALLTQEVEDARGAEETACLELSNLREKIARDEDTRDWELEGLQQDLEHSQDHLDEYHREYENVLKERCGVNPVTGEKQWHCGCVAALRIEHKKLLKKMKLMRADMKKKKRKKESK